MIKLQIEYLPIGKIKPYENNARKHGGDDVDAIEASIEAFDFSDPIGVWGPQNLIVEGHGRLQAAKKAGLKEVPVIHLDHLTEEQQKAYRLAHNKTAELSDWDYDKLNEEIQNIFDIDMWDFGFELVDPFTEHEKYQHETQERVENIENLAKGSFPGTGKYDIPIIQPVDKLPPIREWIGFNCVLTDPDPEGKAVHFFIDDYQFERIWNNPEKYIEKLSRYACVASPDFSPYGDMPMALQIYNHYRKHWVAAYMQQAGVTVIPTIRASTNPGSLEWYLDGEPKNGIVIISSMWTGKKEIKEQFKTELNTMIETLNPKKVFIYGRKDKDIKTWAKQGPEFEFVAPFTSKYEGSDADA